MIPTLRSFDFYRSWGTPKSSGGLSAQPPPPASQRRTFLSSKTTILLVFYLLIKHQVWEWLLPFVPKTLRSIHLLHMQNVWKILKRFLTNLVLILFPFFLYSLTYFLYFCYPKFTFRMIIYNLAKLYESYMMIFFQKLKATADNRLKTQHHTLWFSEVVNDHATYKCQTVRHNCYFHPALNSANNLAINEKNRGENMSHFRINSLDSSYITHWTKYSKKKCNRYKIIFEANRFAAPSLKFHFFLILSHYEWGLLLHGDYFCVLMNSKFFVSSVVFCYVHRHPTTDCCWVLFATYILYQDS